MDVGMARCRFCLQRYETINVARQAAKGLKHGPSNLACAVRILTVVMPCDKVMASKDKRWRWVAGGLGADAHQLQTQRYRRMDAQTGILPEFEISATTTAARCLGHQFEMMPFVGDVLGF